MEFILLYEKIVTECNERIPAPVLQNLQSNKGARFELTLELLREQKVFPLSIFYEINRIHRYYECAVNCRKIEISMEMYLSAKRIVEYLNQQ